MLSPTLFNLLFPLVILDSASATPILGSLSHVLRSPSKSSVVTIPFNRSHQFDALGFQDQSQAESTRLATLVGTSANTTSSKEVVASNSGIAYTAQIGVGSPPTYYNLLIDSGSSNTWLGAIKPYVPTSTSSTSGRTLELEYGVGAANGTEYFDLITLAPSLTISSQSITVATHAVGFADHNEDGILGLGPTDLTLDSIDGTPNGTVVPTVLDNLKAQNTISQEVVSICFYPEADYDSTGILTFGGTNPDLYVGDLVYTPVTKTSPSTHFWGLNMSVNYDTTALFENQAGMVDTGTTMIRLADDFLGTYQKLTGATRDERTNLLYITDDQYDNLQPLNFVIEGSTFALSPNAQIWPNDLNHIFGGQPNVTYLAVGPLNSVSGKGLDFVLGYLFLERFYLVFDTTNNRLGFAYTQSSFDDVNYKKN